VLSAKDVAVVISTDTTFSVFIRAVAPLVWRNDGKVAAKFRRFSSAELGSALDMLKAAELENDPGRRKLFFRHALDEARHSNYFRDHARQMDARTAAREGKYDLIHATRQNLYQKLSPIDFIAFVYLAEKRGEAHFQSLKSHFKDRREIHDLFERIIKDEKFHIGYSKHILDAWTREGRGSEVKAALRKIRLNRAWDAWRRSGRQMGDFVSRLTLRIAYFVIVPPFSLMQRLLQAKEHSGWKQPPHTASTMEEMERMF
jgi:rubrerythrin